MREVFLKLIVAITGIMFLIGIASADCAESPFLISAFAAINLIVMVLTITRNPDVFEKESD